MAIVRDLSGNIPNNAPIVDAHYDKDSPTYRLANHITAFNAGATTPYVQVVGRSYILDYRAGNWNGATLIIETLTADGIAYDTTVSVTDDGKQGVTFGENDLVRLRGTVAVISDLSVSLS